MLRLFRSILLLMLTACTAHAAGAGLRWNTCLGESNRNFACDRSTGSETLVGSFSSPSGMSMIAAEAYLRVTVAEGDMPPWWRMWASSDCRRGSVGFSMDVSTETECDDPWLGNAMGGALPHSVDAQGVDLRAVMAVPSTMPVSISSGHTYAFFRLTINHARSSGSAGCGGCLTPACITLERVVLVPQKGWGRDVEITQGLSGIGGAGNIVTWQGGTPNCVAAAPKGSTWGDLKRRFR